MRGLGVALVFLTRLPLSVSITSSEQIARSVGWFPVVGALLGAIVGFAASTGSRLVSAFVAAAVAVGLGLLITGAFHEDGLADTFDGLAGGFDRDRRLEIMKDSRVGTFGAGALVVVLVVRVGVIVELIAGPPWWPVAALAAAGAVSRAASVAAMRWAPAAAPGLGADQLESVTRASVVVAAILGAGAGAGLGPGGIIGTVVAMVVALAALRWSKRAIGGVTGDVLGAVQVLAELGFLVAVVGFDPGW